MAEAEEEVAETEELARIKPVLNIKAVRTVVMVIGLFTFLIMLLFISFSC